MASPQQLPTIEDVRSFWNENPLFTGESQFEPGSRAWFDEHRKVYIEDCFGGEFDDRTLPAAENRGSVLDLGCGPGFWTVELMQRSAIERMTAADLTPNALALTRARLDQYGLDAQLSEENAESLSFADGTFDHVNCQGVIHHTPSTENAIAEIARVLRPGGTASISVYYRNIVLKQWHWLGWIAGSILGASGAALKGRGREGIYTVRRAEDVVRMYDGSGNPIGKAYDRGQFIDLLSPHFEIDEIYFHFFPARSLPLRIPKGLHRFLDARLPFMIYASVTRRR